MAEAAIVSRRIMLLGVSIVYQTKIAHIKNARNTHPKTMIAGVELIVSKFNNDLTVDSAVAAPPLTDPNSWDPFCAHVVGAAVDILLEAQDYSFELTEYHILMPICHSLTCEHVAVLPRYFQFHPVSAAPT